VAVIVPDEFVGGFVNFLREHSVVGLAIGFVIGLQAQLLVKQLVDSFISPAFTLFFGQSLTHRTFTLHFHSHMGTFGWGAFVYGLLNFLFVLAAIYAIFKYLKLDRLDKPKEEDSK
jgi:large-conductance mechanosensitive channel